MRYQFYREHKYVSHALNEVERVIARCDFADRQECLNVERAFQTLGEMLRMHAMYENERLHSLLKSPVHEHVEKDHEEQEKALETLGQMIEAISNTDSASKRVEQGLTLYLAFRKFVGENLLHLHEEETKILPELQRLYSDAELREVEAPTYRAMAVEEIIEMLQTLFPHMNRVDREAFLNDIELLEPEKYASLSKWYANAQKEALR